MHRRFAKAVVGGRAGQREDAPLSSREPEMEPASVRIAGFASKMCFIPGLGLIFGPIAMIAGSRASASDEEAASYIGFGSMFIGFVSFGLNLGLCAVIWLLWNSKLP
jgi:hypothetical protein